MVDGDQVVARSIADNLGTTRKMVLKGGILSPVRSGRHKSKREEQARSLTEPGGFHPSAWVARGFLLEDAASLSIEHRTRVYQ